MPRLTAFVLRHRLLVVVFWLVLAAAGGLTVGTTTGRLSQSFAAPGSPAQNAADRIVARGGKTTGCGESKRTGEVAKGKQEFQERR